MATELSPRAEGASPHPPFRLVNAGAIADALGVSIEWLRKDRRTKRLIPFHKLGDRVLYDPERVREALRGLEQGGLEQGGHAVAREAQS